MLSCLALLDATTSYQESFELCSWHGPGIQKDLDFFTILGTQEGGLSRCFHAFSDDSQSKVVSHHDDGAGDGGILC
jgi:hypothetical protein